MLSSCFIETAHIVCVSAPWPAGSYSELKIFEQDLFYKLGPAEFALTDSGYGGTKCIPPPLPSHPMSKKFAQLRPRHEAVNGRLKKF